jgi:hypothetical protein
METRITRFDNNFEYVPSDDNTINIVLFCDIDEPKKYDFVIFWLSYANQYMIKNTKYHINFDYETNLNMATNKYNLHSTPSIRLIQKNHYIEYTDINLNDYNYEYLMDVINKAINELIFTCEKSILL